MDVGDSDDFPLLDDPIAATLTKPSARGAASERLERAAAVGASVRAMEKLSAMGAASASSRTETERAAERRFALPDLPPSRLVLLVLLPPILAVMGVGVVKRKMVAAVVAVLIFMLNVVVQFQLISGAKLVEIVQIMLDALCSHSAAASDFFS